MNSRGVTLYQWVRGSPLRRRGSAIPSCRDPGRGQFIEVDLIEPGVAVFPVEVDDVRVEYADALAVVITDRQAGL